MPLVVYNGCTNVTIINTNNSNDDDFDNIDAFSETAQTHARCMIGGYVNDKDTFTCNEG